MDVSCAHVAEFLEILSDALGFVAGCVLVIPALYYADGRERIKLLKEITSEKVLSAEATDSLNKLIENHSGASHNPNEKWQLVSGSGLLAVSFAMKLAYHAISKHLICG